MDELLRDFVAETTERLDAADDALGEAGTASPPTEALAAVLRLLHTVKGNCGFLGLRRLELLAHEAEGRLLAARDDGAPWLAVAEAAEAVGALREAVLAIAAREGLAPPNERSPFRSVQLDATALDGLGGLVGELAAARNELAAAAALGSRPPPAVTRLDRVAEAQVAALADACAGDAFRALPRLAESLSAELGRPVRVAMEGAGVALPAGSVPPLADALVQLVRNAAVHGLEAPAERVRHGKPETGTVAVHASREGGTVRVAVSDDGRGFDLAALRRRAAELGLLVPAGDAEAVALAFHCGLSTATAPSVLAGHGIGLDAVRAMLAPVGGSVAAENTARGAQVTLHLPAPPEHVRLLVVTSAGECYGVPYAAVTDVLHTASSPRHRATRLADGVALWLDGAAVPTVELAALVGGEPPQDEPDFVLLAGPDGPVALAVERLSHAETVATGARGVALDGTPLRGSGILADGRPVLLIGPAGVAAAAAAQVQPERRLLLVETTPFFRTHLAPMLAQAGYQVTAAATAEAMLAAMVSGHFAAVVVDTDTPGLVGPALDAALDPDTRPRLVAIGSKEAPGFDAALSKFDREGLLRSLAA